MVPVANYKHLNLYKKIIKNLHQLNMISTVMIHNDILVFSLCHIVSFMSVVIQ